LVYHSLSGMASAYLAADCQLSSGEGRRQLCSADTLRTFTVRRTYTATLGNDVSRLLAQGCGTAFQLVIGKRTSGMNSLLEPPPWTESVVGPVASGATVYRTDVMCSVRRVPVMSRAGAFWVDCSRLIWLSVIPVCKAVSYSNQADSWWKPGQASEQLSASVTGSSVVIGAAGSK